MELHRIFRWRAVFGKGLQVKAQDGRARIWWLLWAPLSRTRYSRGVCKALRRNISLELLDHELLIGNDRFDQIADGDDAD